VDAALNMAVFHIEELTRLPVEGCAGVGAMVFKGEITAGMLHQEAIHLPTVLFQVEFQSTMGWELVGPAFKPIH
jgi:hypothetical protein